MMLFYHLFFSGATASGYSPLVNIGSTPLVTIISRACNPVMIFIILSGYGLHHVYRHGSLALGKQMRRLAKLYMSYWLTLLIFVPIGIFIRPTQYPGTVTDIVGNITGYLSNYNFETWFIFPYALMCLTAYPVFKTQHRVGNVVAAIASGLLLLGASFVISRYIAPRHANDSVLAHLLTYLQFIFPLVIGGWMHDVAERRGLRFLRPNNLLIFSLLLLLVGLRMTITTHAFNAPYAALFILLMLQFRNVSQVLKQLFSFFGKYSLMMWLTHTYFCNYLFRDFIFSFRYPVVIYIVLIALSLAVAMPLTKLYQRIQATMLK